MKQKIITLLGLLIIPITLLLYGTYFHGNGSREKLLCQLIYSGLERWHYSGKKIDDNFSEKAFGGFLEYMDTGKRFLLKEDIAVLKKYTDQIDDQFSSGNTEMMDSTSALLEKRIQQVMAFYPQLLEKPFDYSKEEYLEINTDNKVEYFNNLAELKESWRKVLKYRTLIRYLALMETQQDKTINVNAKEKDKMVKVPAKRVDTSKIDWKIEAKARQEVLKNFKSYFKRLLQGTQNDSLSIYLNSLVQIFDPHSTYFPPVDKESFDMQMSGSFEGIGATLLQEEEYVKVSGIVPGSPSWREKQLQPGDLILKVGQGDEEAVDIIGMRTQEAVKLIRGKKGTRVKLTVKKPDGRIIVVPIVRDVVVLEETFAKSAVLVQTKMNKRIGYIHLPGFYNDFAETGGRNSTDDVHKELDILKAAKVDGIILDLRNNGGGALLDAVNMSGLFIPQGPIVQVKAKDSKVSALDDPDPDVAYNGPLIVLVNTLSASASEILAAALQDYNRAVIVGGVRSYGKGTVQAMVSLDRFVGENTPPKKSYGALTITIQKFYRISGASIQLKGVTPNIVLPDRFDSFEIGESYMDYPLPADTVPPASFKKWQDIAPTTSELITRSKARVASSSSFQAVRKYIQLVKEMRQETRQSLKLADVVNQQEKLKIENDNLNQADTEMTFFQVLASRKTVQKESDPLNKLAMERQTEWFKEIKKDIILGEAVEILSDMLQVH